MLLTSLLLTPTFTIILLVSMISYKLKNLQIKLCKIIILTSSIINFLISLVIYLLFDFSTNQFQFVQESYEIIGYNIYLGIDGLSIYFILLTTIIMPIAILSN